MHLHRNFISLSPIFSVPSVRHSFSHAVAGFIQGANSSFSVSLHISVTFAPMPNPAASAAQSSPHSSDNDFVWKNKCIRVGWFGNSTSIQDSERKSLVLVKTLSKYLVCHNL